MKVSRLFETLKKGSLIQVSTYFFLSHPCLIGEELGRKATKEFHS
jgi:hypothetical protein